MRAIWRNIGKTVTRRSIAVFCLSLLPLSEISSSVAQTCKPKFYFIEGARISSSSKDGFMRELYSLLRQPYRDAGASVTWFTHHLSASSGQQFLHSVTTGYFGSRYSELVRSVATTGWNDSHNPIVLVGHSWGGATAYWLTGTFAEYSRPGRRLVLATLDPVSFNHSPLNINPIEKLFQLTEGLFGLERIPHPGDTLIHLKYGYDGKSVSNQQAKRRIAWFHSYVAPKSLGCGDLIAQAGGWWGRRGNADLKLQTNRIGPWPKWYNKIAPTISHCDVIPMYYIAQDFVIQEIKKTCGFELPKGTLSLSNGRATLVFTQ